MAASFENGLLASVNIVEQTIYTAPSGQTGKHLLMAALATNIYGSAIPITFKLVRNAETIYIAYNQRIQPNTQFDLLQGTKISLDAGDLLKMSAPVDGAFSAIVTVTEEVLT